MRKLGILAFFAALPVTISAYPLDAYDETGIRRLEAYRLITEGELSGRRQPAGALLPRALVDLRLTHHRNASIPPPDPELTQQIEELLGDNADRYGIAVLDISDPRNPRYAEVNGDYRQNVGSVGKIVAALGLFQALADTWPDVGDRLRILKERIVTADKFAYRDTHSVPFFDIETQTLTKRSIADGDQATLFEYVDWMLSPSSNSAAGMVMREAMLIRHFGQAYPPTDDEADTFFEETPGTELTDLYRETFDEPLARHGFDLDDFRQGSFFTRGGKQAVHGSGTSYATARSLLRYGMLLEKGLLVDEFTSRELKRLLYVTERRIRYASSPALRDSAVYFKSGSLYSCQPEEGFHCGKYKGNRKNYMNSFAIVESPAGERKQHYMVMLISNVLKQNSAVDHQTLGTRIHRLMQQAHTTPEP
jgi:hypothetical protein